VREKSRHSDPIREERKWPCLPVLKAEKTGPVTQENNASAFFGAASTINIMIFPEADHLISDYVMHPTLWP
jgi:hypothetical protein